MENYKFIGILFTIVVSSCAQKKAEFEKYFIPVEYRGKVLVVYGVTGGLGKNYLNNYRIYEIAANGILRTKFEINSGIHSDVYKEVKFYLTSKKDTLELPVIYGALNLKAEVNDRKVHVFEVHDGYFNAYRYTTFFVDTLSKGKNYPDKYFSDYDLDSLFKKENLISN